MELTKSVLDCISTIASGLIRINPQFPKENMKKKYSVSTRRFFTTCTFSFLHLLTCRDSDLIRAAVNHLLAVLPLVKRV